MAAKRTLYQLLEVRSDASLDVIKAAYEARSAKLAHAVTPEDAADRAMLRDALETLADPARREKYDIWLREERMRALSGGGTDDARPRPANTRETNTPSIVETSWSMAQIMYGVAAVSIALVVGAWVYFDHARKVTVLRLEAEKAALEAKTRQEEAERRAEYATRNEERMRVARERSEAYREAAETRRTLEYGSHVGRQIASDQERANQQKLQEERRKQADLQRAEMQRQREESESMRRSQQQLERDRRYLQELERNRGQKF